MPEREERHGASFSGYGRQEDGETSPGLQSGGEKKGVGGERPDLRVVQVEYDSRLGKSVYKDVGAMWKNTSKAGNEFYTMKIGKLKLLVFPNNKS